MGKSAPDAPDYTAAAQAQGQSSLNAIAAQTQANRPDQYTPFGSQTWDQTQNFDQSGYARAMQDWNAQYSRADGDDARNQLLALRPSQNDYYRTDWTQTTSLTPEAQGALDSQLQLQQGRSDLANSLFPRAQDEFGQPMDWGGFNEFQNSPDVPQYGEGLVDYATGPQAQSYGQNLADFSFGPGQNSYSAEDIQRGIDPSQDYVQRAEDAIYGQWSNRQEPRMQQQMEQTETRLRNQGLRPGDQAYDEAMQRMGQDQNDARLMAQYQATIGSGTEGQRLQGMDLGAGNFANQASQQALNQQLAIGGQQFDEGSQAADRGNMIRQQQMAEQFGIGDRAFQQGTSAAEFQNSLRGQQLSDQLATGGQEFNQGMSAANMNNTIRQQQIAEEMQRRGFSLNEINAIITGQQVGMPNMPGFNNAGAAQPTNYMGAAQNQYQAALDAANAQNAGFGNLLGGATQLGSAAMMFSDRRLKTDIRATGEFVRGVPIYEFRYLWDQPDMVRVGVMADEAECVPGVVHMHESGYKMVNYGRLFS